MALLTLAGRLILAGSIASCAESVGLLAPAQGMLAWDPDRRLTHSSGARTSINFARNIAADAQGRVHVVWFEQRSGGGEELFTQRSLDGGTTWQAPLRLTDAPGDSHYPTIAATGDLVHIAWWDTRDQGRTVIYYARSLDAGLTWSAGVAISDSPVQAAYPSIAVSDDVVHVAYVDFRDGNEEVYYLRSLDRGTTWQPAVRLSAVPHNSYTPTIAVHGTHVYVAWTDTRHGGATQSLEEEYFRRSTDQGATWDPELRLTFDPDSQPANSWAPSLAADGADVWIVWFDQRDGNWEIYTKRSGDRGLTWSADTRLTDHPAESVRPSISVDGSSLYVVWWDTRDGNEEIYAKHSPDRGQTWEPDSRLTHSPGQSVFASVAAAAGGVYVVWQDTREGQPEVYFKRRKR